MYSFPDKTVYSIMTFNKLTYLVITQQFLVTGYFNVNTKIRAFKGNTDYYLMYYVSV